MKTVKLALGATIASLMTGTAIAQSAKFAATYTTEPALASVVDVTSSSDTGLIFDISKGYTLATIKVPQDKELLVGISAEIGLVTSSSAKGKNGGSATASAGAGTFVRIFARPLAGGEIMEAAPGKVILSKRLQQLSATLGGVIESCTDGDANGTIDVTEECVVSDEEIGLLQETTAAHHFNFVLPNMNQGDYEIKAVFVTGTGAEIDVCELCGGTVEASAAAKAIVNKTMMTVQQVRAIKGGILEMDITSP